MFQFPAFAYPVSYTHLLNPYAYKQSEPLRAVTACLLHNEPTSYSSPARLSTCLLYTSANRACSELGIYAVYSLLYGTHTASPNQAVAVLGDGSVYRMLYLKLPSKTSETAAVPFTVLAAVIVPGEVINSGTSYYPMKNEGYMFFATDNGPVSYTHLFPVQISVHISFDFRLHIPTFDLIVMVILNVTGK